MPVETSSLEDSGGLGINGFMTSVGIGVSGPLSERINKL